MTTLAPEIQQISKKPLTVDNAYIVESGLKPIIKWAGGKEKELRYEEFLLIAAMVYNING